MRYLRNRAAVAIAVAIAGVPAVPSVASPAATAVFGDLRLGAWEIRERGSDRSRRICLRSESDLVQLRHRGQSCRRIVIDDAGTDATVQYSCSGSGYGRTHMRRESPVLVQLQSDGIERGAPFSLEAEARRVGDCK